MSLDLEPILGDWLNTWSTPTVLRLRVSRSETGVRISAVGPETSGRVDWGEVEGTPLSAGQGGSTAQGFAADFTFDDVGGARLGVNLGNGLLSVMIFSWDGTGVTYSREFFHRVEVS